MSGDGNRLLPLLLRHSAVYGVAQLVSRVASVALLPVYTRLLSPSDYGTVAVLDFCTSAVAIVIGAGMAPAVIRHHFETKNERERDAIWWTGLTVQAIIATAIVVFVWLTRNSLASAILGASLGEGSSYLAIAAATLWFSSVGQLSEIYLRVRKWSLLFLALSVTRLLLGIGLNLYFLIVLHMGVLSIMLGSLITAVLSTTTTLLIFRNDRGKYMFHYECLEKLVRFGWPLILTGVLTIIIDQADRYMLRLFVDMSAVGVYSVAYVIAQAANNLYVVPFTSIWRVEMYEVAERPNAQATYASVFRYYAYGLMLFMLAISFCARPFFAIMTPPEYADAAKILPIICLGLVFFNIHEHFAVPALLAKATVSLLPAHLIAAVLNIVLNVVLIPMLGTYGAALATVASYAAFSFTGLLLYRRIDRYDYPLVKCSIVLLGLVASYLALWFLEELQIPTAGLVACGSGILAIWTMILIGKPLSKVLRQYIATEPVR